MDVIVEKPVAEFHVNQSVETKRGFFESITHAYSQLTARPFAFSLFVFSTISLVAETNNQTGPFEILNNTLTVYINSKPQPNPIILVFATLLLGVVHFILAYKSKVFLFMTAAVIPAVNSSINPLLFIMLIFYLSVSNHASWALFLIIQILYVYYFMEGGFNRIILYIILAYLVLGSDNLSLMFTPKTLKF
uniref:Uncharacterized protein n=1 Tax=Entomophthora virgavirus A TaxID=2592730 RepID=A0A7G3KJ19_9VIRU|nr:hypothetical protein [Entomophthora virgavirus A]